MPIATKNRPGKVRICVDRGGTFCDVIGITEDGETHLVKLLSVDPTHYPDAPREGVRRILEWFLDRPVPREQPIETDRIEYIRMGTTVATNALLERKGERSALLITKGFRDVLEIGTQSRPFLFQLAISKPGVLYEDVVEVEERVVPEWSEWIEEGKTTTENGERLVKVSSGATMRILQELDVEGVTADLAKLRAQGYDSIAIAFAHSYLFPDHENRVRDIAKGFGFKQISVSSELQAMINLVSRGQSATADAYLTPQVTRYLEGFAGGFKGGLQDGSCRVSFMQSDGSLCDFRSFSGLRAVLSGPAGGVVGFARTSYDPLDGSPVVGFDMGGTSTDVSRYSGAYEHVFETTTAGVTIQVPQLDINTVAAGGGSILTYRDGLFAVGPESASADPGPACYRKGGPLTITDANVFLGRIHIDSFPKIFGPNEDLPLDVDIVREKFEALAKRINAENEGTLTAAEVASGFIDVANSSMARPIRALTEQRGFRTSSHHLACFGGAGGQHACALASLLGMHTVIVHKYSSLLSAWGMALGDVAVDLSEPHLSEYSPSVLPDVDQKLDALKSRATEQLIAQGVHRKDVVYESYLNLKYRNSDTKIMVQRPDDSDFAAAFIAQHKREFSFVLEAPIDIEDVRVRAVGVGEQRDPNESTYVEELRSLPNNLVTHDAKFASNSVFFAQMGRYVDTPLYRLSSLKPGDTVQGPAIILDATQTILLHPGNTARILNSLVYIDVGLGEKKILDATVVDPIQLSIFGHRFMGIAEQMGRALQKTAVSVQIKERLDFSCAIFDGSGALVANAPNVPVHLGSMQYAVQFQAQRHKGKLRPGDILVSNHPRAGGTHLPDITVMQPVFAEGSDNEIVFWVAARGHHTDIGGLEGNSTHPDATENWHEGATFISYFLVRDGVFGEEDIKAEFAKAGSYPNCLAPRRLDHNMSDLKAQCSACSVGTNQIQNLFAEYSKEVVLHYMAAIRTNAELAVRSFLKSQPENTFSATDYMDDGTVINLVITIDKQNGNAKFDFTGTGPESLTNLNAPESVVRSAIIYSLRTLIGTDMPLNAGVLAPVELYIPPDTILSPSDDAAVSCGNTETSQRVVDVVFKAFEACAAGQGCMNGTHFDYKHWTYGETICGGAGAGPTWEGASAVHVNMTNTRIGDVEIVEKRFPLILREFSIRARSGGRGQHSGGNGIRRVYEARTPMHAGHIGERRVNQPYGMHGGHGGERGASFWMRRKKDGSYRTVKLRPCAAASFGTGDRLVVHTPGGGGYGALEGEATIPMKRKAAPAASEAPRKTYSRANGSISAYAAAQESVD